jgi:alpha-glucosidase
MEVVKFWLDRGVDGFRLDVFNLWFKDSGMRDNPFAWGLRGYDRQQHIFDMDQPEMMPALADFRSILDSYPEKMSVGEYLGRDNARAASYCGSDRLHMVFNFNFTDCGWNPSAFQDAILEWEAALSEDAWPCYVLSNHDGHRRHVSRYGGKHPDQIAKIAAAMLLTLRGTPFLYYGEEIGMPDVKLSRGQMLDPISRRYWPFYSRDPGRTPMQWSRAPNAGFTTGKPWLPLHPDHPRRNVESQSGDEYSVLNFYRSLLRLRRSSRAMRRGCFVPLLEQPKDGLAYLRTDEDSDALVCLNFRARPIRIAFGGQLPPADWSLQLSSEPLSNAVVENNSVALLPLEAAIFFSNPVS